MNYSSHVFEHTNCQCLGQNEADGQQTRKTITGRI